MWFADLNVKKLVLEQSIFQTSLSFFKLNVSRRCKRVKINALLLQGGLHLLELALKTCQIRLRAVVWADPCLRGEMPADLCKKICGIVLKDCTSIVSGGVQTLQHHQQQPLNHYHRWLWSQTLSPCITMIPSPILHQMTVMRSASFPTAFLWLQTPPWLLSLVSAASPL